MRLFIRTTLAAALVAGFAVLTGPAGPALAGTAQLPPLNPAPADYYSCAAKGAGIYCSGELVEPYGPEATGLFCGSGTSAFEVLDRATRHTHAERWYDREGNLLKRKRVFEFA